MGFQKMLVKGLFDITFEYFLIFHIGILDIPWAWNPAKFSIFCSIFSTFDLSICILLYIVSDALGNLTRKCLPGRFGPQQHFDCGSRGVPGLRGCCGVLAERTWTKHQTSSDHRCQVMVLFVLESKLGKPRNRTFFQHFGARYQQLECTREA